MNSILIIQHIFFQNEPFLLHKIISDTSYINIDLEIQISSHSKKIKIKMVILYNAKY